MARPRPSPPFTGVAAPPAWRNRSKTWGRNATGMPGPRVLDRDLDLPVHAVRLHGHRPAVRRELDGVREQVPEDLLQPARVPRHRARVRGHVGGERHALGFRGGADRLQRGADHRHRLDGLDVEPHRARDHARHVEQVRDEAGLEPRVPQDRVEGAGRGRLVDVHLAQDVRPAEHGAERACAARGRRWRGTRPSDAPPRAGAPRSRAAPARGPRSRPAAAPGRAARPRGPRPRWSSSPTTP